jgi:RND family efflux transporter MFP subunit
MRARSIALVPILLAAGCARPVDDVAPAPSPAVSVAVVTKVPEAPIVRRSVVTSGARMRLGFRTPGVVDAIYVKTGEAVRPGQVLARLRAGEAAAKLELARVSRAKAKQLASLDAHLAATGSIPQVQSDAAQQDLEASEANVRLAADAVASTKLVATTRGVVYERLAEPGEVVDAATAVLLVDKTLRLVARIGVTDHELPRVHVGQSATLLPRGSTEMITGRVSSVAPAPDTSDGLYAVEVELEGRVPAAVRPGTETTVTLLEDNPTSSLRVPLDALVYRNEKAWVFVVSGTTGEARADLRETRLDRVEGDTAVVGEGLHEGDRIVAEGAYFLLDHQRVQVLGGT